MSILREIQEKLSYQTKKQQALQEEFDLFNQEYDEAPSTLLNSIKFQVNEMDYNAETQKGTPAVGDVIVDNGKIGTVTELADGKVRTESNYFEPEFLKLASTSDNPKHKQFAQQLAIKHPKARVWIYG